MKLKHIFSICGLSNIPLFVNVGKFVRDLCKVFGDRKLGNWFTVADARDLKRL